ncbi:hypothetical protein Tco_0304758, partial [Tanacetum coccineum]
FKKRKVAGIDACWCSLKFRFLCVRIESGFNATRWGRVM